MAMNDVPIWSIAENMLTENAIYWEVISVKSCPMDLQVKSSKQEKLTEKCHNHRPTHGTSRERHRTLTDTR